MIVVQEYVKRDLQGSIERKVEEIVLELSEDKERTPLNQLLICVLKAQVEIYKELDKLEGLAENLQSKKAKIDRNSKDFLTLRGVLVEMWINNIMAVRLNCVDEDVLNEMIKMDERMIEFEENCGIENIIVR